MKQFFSKFKTWGISNMKQFFSKFKISEKGKHDYYGAALRLQTPHEYYNDRHYNLLSITLFKWYWWFQIPEIIKPKSQWVDLTDREWANPGKDGRKGYTNHIQRIYGFATHEDAIHVYYGIHPGSWSAKDPANSDHVKLFYIPWKQWDRERIEYLNPDHSLFEIYRDNKNGSINFTSMDDIRDRMPKVKFKFKDFDGEEVIATCYFQNSIYHLGTGAFKFLRYFFKRSYPRMEITFDKETGYEKGSWKGGTLGTSCEFKFGETPLETFTRYANETDHYKNHGKKPRGMHDIKVIE